MAARDSSKQTERGKVRRKWVDDLTKSRSDREREEERDEERLQNEST
jgi:hypothetical protein